MAATAAVKKSASARSLWRCVCFLTDDVMNVYLVCVSLFFPDACIYIYNRNSFEQHKRSSGNMYREAITNCTGTYIYRIGS